jgi:hypothetical protein
VAADIELLEELYAFAKDRAQDRIRKAHSQDAVALRSAREHLRWLQWTYAEAMQSDVKAVAAIDYFCELAMRHKDHPDYQAGWRLGS